MKIIRSLTELQFSAPRVGFVPTMGALHEGHLSLMRQAKAECGFCVASIFVNPTQFGPNEDFNKYPRDEARDFELAESAGVDAVFCPTVEEVYSGSCTTVRVSGVADRWEGPLRPGHFEGVATVVHKLFGMVRPQVAYFGLKDFQQCRVIAKMVSDLYLPVELVFCETIREPDGLAMSSRNRYLSPEERVIAPKIYEVLRGVAGADIFAPCSSDRSIGSDEQVTLKGSNLSSTGSGVADPGFKDPQFRTLEGCRIFPDVISQQTPPMPDSSLTSHLNRASSDLTNAGFRVEYLAAVSAEMHPIEAPEPGSRLIVAAWLGKTRLIDNVALS